MTQAVVILKVILKSLNKFVWMLSEDGDQISVNLSYIKYLALLVK